MTNATRFLRHLTQDPRCLMCGYVEENIEHILRFCPAARMVWNMLGGKFEGQQQLNLQDWMLYNLDEKRNRNCEDWPLIFAVTCWWLWRWRNERSFVRECEIPIDQAAFVLTRVGEIRRAYAKELHRRPNKRQKSEVLVRWEAPPCGWVCLHTDGAAKGNLGPAGAGGIIRGASGEIFEAFAMNCGSCTCKRAKLLVVLRGLAIAWNGGHRKIKLKADSQVVTRMLVEATPPNSPFVHLIRKCKSLIRCNGWEITIEHCFREANRAADWLANFGVLSEQKLVMFEAIPVDFRTILLEELRGVAIPRMVRNNNE